MASEGKGRPKAKVVAQALDAHALELRRFVVRRVPATYVDDVLQSAAMHAIERSGSLNDPGRVVSWLYRIHRNVMTDTLRKRARRERVLNRDAPLPPLDAGTTAADAPCRCSFVQARSLKPTYLAVLRLVDAGDTSLVEAANILGISTNNATVRLHRARKALRSTMLDHCGVQSAQDCADCRCVYDGCCAA